MDIKNNIENEKLWKCSFNCEFDLFDAVSFFSADVEIGRYLLTHKSGTGCLSLCVNIDQPDS